MDDAARRNMQAVGVTPEGGGKKGGPPPPDYRAAMAAQGPAIDWSGFGQIGNGETAANAVYNQATSRLDPQWQRREDAARTQLINQGFTPESEAWRNAMTDLGNDRNDAYSQAFANSFGQGNQLMQTNMAARQQAVAEALKRRSQPLDELGIQQGLWNNNQQMQASLNPLNAVGDFLGGALDVASNFVSPVKLPKIGGDKGSKSTPAQYNPNRGPQY